MRLLVFGYGFTGRTLALRRLAAGWDVAALVRNPETLALADRDGVQGVLLDDHAAMLTPLLAPDALLLTAPPTDAGCPALAALGPALETARPGWIGYLSTTGVYGDRGGGWVFETDPATPKSAEGVKRAAAEQAWLDLTARLGLNLAIFRLPGIYGPGRSTLDRVRAGQAKRITSPTQVFSRIHVEDLAVGLEASIARPRPAAIYNLCDDEPAPNSDVVAYAAGLLGITPPPEIPLEDAKLAPAAMRFYAESKRVSNARAKAELGWRPAFPTYREGLTSILNAGG